MDHPQYLSQLLAGNSDSSQVMLKSEEDHDYSGNNSVFLPSDCSSYFPQQHSPIDSPFSTLQSPPPFSTPNTGMFNPVTCTPTNHMRNTSIQQALPQMNTRVNVNSMYMQPRMGMGNELLLNNMEQLPDTTIFPGPCNFQLYLGPHTDSATKSADYTFSTSLKKLYVQRGAHCPFKFKTSSPPPPNSYVKIIPVFKGTHVLSEPVRRCSNHAEGDDEAIPRYHFMRANNRQTNYETSETGRLFLTIPYTGPQVGAEFQVELLSFMCFNSCGHSSHSKRRIDVIFMLECNGQVLGRQVIEVRVCACPGRDRTNEEFSTPKSGNKGYKRGGYYGGASKGAGKRRKLSSVGGDQEYTITTNNPVFHQILSQVLESLESNISQLVTDMSSPLSHSPLSAVSSPLSPGNVFSIPTSLSDSVDLL